MNARILDIVVYACDASNFAAYGTSDLLDVIEHRCEMLTGISPGNEADSSAYRLRNRWPELIGSGQAWALLPSIPWADIEGAMPEVTSNLHKFIDHVPDRLSKIRRLHAETAGVMIRVIQNRGTISRPGALRSLLMWCVLDSFLNDRATAVRLPDWYMVA